MWMFDMLPEGAFEPRPGGGMRLYGGKGGGSAPPPDPRLIEAQIKSLGVQDDAIKSILELSTRMQPLQEEQLRFGLDSARTAFDQAQADREYGLGRRAALTGLQNTLVADAKGFKADERGDQLAGQAVGDVTQAFAAARDSGARQMARMGVNPNDGKFAAFSKSTDAAEALGKAQAATKAREGARMEGYALTDRATNALAGFPAFSSQATGQGAQFGASGIGLTNQSLDGQTAGARGAASVAGQMGTNAGNAWNAQANYQANMQQQDQTGSILGGLGGLAVGAAKIAPLFSASDRRLKQDIELVGRDEVTGLNLYEFSYINDPEHTRYVGVMADEVEPRFPAAVKRDARGMASVDYQMLGIEFKEVA